MAVRLQQEFGAIGSSGDTTVSRDASPSGISVFLTSPSTSVWKRRAFA
jgi:hypothetical protein